MPDFLPVAGFDAVRFAAMVRAKRAKRGLRSLASELADIYGSGAPTQATIGRIENGKPPDVGNFLVLCDWLGVCPSQFLLSGTEERQQKPDTLTAVAGALSGDERLSGATVAAILQFVRVATGEGGSHA